MPYFYGLYISDSLFIRLKFSSYKLKAIRNQLYTKCIQCLIIKRNVNQIFHLLYDSQYSWIGLSAKNNNYIRIVSEVVQDGHHSPVNIQKYKSLQRLLQLIIKISHKMSENVKVMVRCRPFNKKEDERFNVVHINQQMHQLTISRAKGMVQHQRTFTFDHIFGPQSIQKQVYQQSAFLLVQNVLEGFNGTIFAYGQTGCGKTYTMNGPKNEQQRGIIPRSFHHIITRTLAEKQKQYLLHCSYIQIYNEEVYDLFEKKTKTKLEVKEAPGKGTFIKDQKLQIVKSVEDMYQLFQLGSKNRAIRETSFNKNSSRSHCIFTVYMESSEENNGAQIFKAGKLNLVDLAGSERQSKIKLAGEGFKQTTRINLSLSALGNVISALVDGKSHHIPYRDSKLTRLLQDSLGGNTRTVMIATISPAQSSFEQTLSTLRYASRTKFIKNKPVINQDPKDTLLRQYAEQIRKLKTMLQQLNFNIQISHDNSQNKNNGILNSTHRSQMSETERQELLAAQQQREQLRQKLQALQKILAKQEVQEDATEIDKINKLKDKLKEQQWKEQQYLIDKQKREEELLTLQTNYKSLNEEVDLLRERFSELKTKYMQSQQQNKDLRKQFEAEKQDLLSTIRYQELQISKYRGISEMVLKERQIEQILNKSKIDEQEGVWNIKHFLLKENMVIFPQGTSNSLGELIRREKSNINMFVSEDKKNKASVSNISNISGQRIRNTKESFGALSENNTRNRNKSLSDLKSIKQKYSYHNNSQKKPSSINKSKISNLYPQRQKQALAPVEQKKKLNIDIGKLKMDILTELSKKKI